MTQPDYIYLNGGEPIYGIIGTEYPYAVDWTLLGGTSSNLANPEHVIYKEFELDSAPLTGSTAITNAPIQTSKLITIQDDPGQRYVSEMTVDIDGVKRTCILIIIPVRHGSQHV